MKNINYEPLYEFALKHRIGYNEVCAVVRDSLSIPASPTSELRLVPLEPTKAMLDAGQAVFRSYSLRHTFGHPAVWAAMVAAAPGQETTQLATSDPEGHRQAIADAEIISPRPSQEWYREKINETLDDDFSIGHAATPVGELYGFQRSSLEDIATELSKWKSVHMQHAAHFIRAVLATQPQIHDASNSVATVSLNADGGYQLVITGNSLPIGKHALYTQPTQAFQDLEDAERWRELERNRAYRVDRYHKGTWQKPDTFQDVIDAVDASRRARAES